MTDDTADLSFEAHCEAKLAGAQAKIEQITVGSDGKISTAPFDTEKPA
jgi:exonuclease VII small subunit